MAIYQPFSFEFSNGIHRHLGRHERQYLPVYLFMIRPHWLNHTLFAHMGSIEWDTIWSQARATGKIVRKRSRYSIRISIWKPCARTRSRHTTPFARPSPPSLRLTETQLSSGETKERTYNVRGNPAVSKVVKFLTRVWCHENRQGHGRARLIEMVRKNRGDTGGSENWSPELRIK